MIFPKTKWEKQKSNRKQKQTVKIDAEHKHITQDDIGNGLTVDAENKLNVKTGPNGVVINELGEVDLDNRKLPIGSYVGTAQDLKDEMITGDRDLLKLINVNAGAEILGFIQDTNLEKVIGKRYVDQITGKVFLCKNPGHVNTTTDFISCDIVNNTNKIETKAHYKRTKYDLKAGVTKYIRLNEIKHDAGLCVFRFHADVSSNYGKGGFIVNLTDPAFTWETEEIMVNLSVRQQNDNVLLVKGNANLGQAVNHLYLSYTSANDKTLTIDCR